MSDEKIKTANSKVPLNLIPLHALKGLARVFGFGAKKYAPGNYYTASDVEIANRYIGGLLRHIADAQLPNGLFDWSSLSSLDVESGLPEIDHALCGLIMLRALAIKHGALPADPGIGNEPTTPAQRAMLECRELPTEALVREARVENGAFDVAPPVSEFTAYNKTPRPTGPGDAS